MSRSTASDFFLKIPIFHVGKMGSSENCILQLLAPSEFPGESKINSVSYRKYCRCPNLGQSGRFSEDRVIHGFPKPIFKKWFSRKHYNINLLRFWEGQKPSDWSLKPDRSSEKWGWQRGSLIILRKSMEDEMTSSLKNWKVQKCRVISSFMLLLNIMGDPRCQLHFSEDRSGFKLQPLGFWPFQKRNVLIL